MRDSEAASWVSPCFSVTEMPYRFLKLEIAYCSQPSCSWPMTATARQRCRDTDGRSGAAERRRARGRRRPGHCADGEHRGGAKHESESDGFLHSVPSLRALILVSTGQNLRSCGVGCSIV